MDKNERAVGSLLILFFLLVIYAVPVVQGVVEARRGRSIQVLDLFVDLLSTPYRNANTLHGLAEKLAGQSAEIDSGVPALASAPDSLREPAALESLLDEALFTASEMRRTAYALNRHVRADSTAPMFRALDTVSALLSEVLQTVRDKADLSRASGVVSDVKTRADRIRARYPRRGPLSVPVLAALNLKNILWNDKYLRPYEKEMENTSTFATTARPQVQFVRYVLFGDLGEKAMGGSNSWMFYKPDVEYLVRPYVRDPRSVVVDPNDKPVSDNPVEAIVTFKRQLDSLGVELLMVIMPGKPSIYPDLLSTALRPEQSGKISHSARMMQDLRSRGVECVDLFSVFAKERLRDAEAGDSVYLQKDTHWKARGVLEAARVVAQRVKEYPWYRPGSTEYAVDSVTVDRVGDVGVMSTLPAFRIGELSMAFPPEKAKCYQVYAVGRDGQGAETGRVLYKDDFRNSPVLLLGDSFSRIYQTDEPRSAGWIAHLARELSQPIASIVNDGGASTLVRETLSRKSNVLRGKKLVIWEVVERDFRFGAEGWKHVPIKL